MMRARIRRPRRTLWLVAVIGLSAAAAATSAAVSSASASAGAPSATSPSPAPASLSLASVPDHVLAEYSIKLAAPPSSLAATATTGRGEAIKTAEAQPISAWTKVRQAVLARVTFSARSPAGTGLYWVVSLQPHGDVPIFGGPHKAHPKIPSSYYVIFIDAHSGTFYTAIIG